MHPGKKLLDLLFPPRCPFCREILRPYQAQDGLYPVWANAKSLPEAVCSKCAAELPWIGLSCPLCGRGLEDGRRCSCRPGSYAFDNCCALGRYTGNFREALHHLKYRQKKWIARPLGRLLSWKLITMSWLSSVEGLVPVPLSLHRQTGRGYNQAALLSGVVGGELGLPVLEILEKVRETESQTGMNRESRWENMQGVFRPIPSQNKYNHLLLIDDVFTTGATAHDAARALISRCAVRVSVAVIAR